jgi:hypothetical protein
MSSRRRLLVALTAAVAALAPTASDAFCGFYVGKADVSLFNEASQVVLVRDGVRTVVTMSNDYRGELTDFALVVPVPSVITREQIHITDRKYIERLDAYSAPRLVEYHDPDPCALDRFAAFEGGPPMAKAATVSGSRVRDEAKTLGVTVEAQYTVGEYDIVILSAKQSEGLETWLRQSGYRIPPKASAALAPYIRQDMKFFVAKVNLKEQKALGATYLRPIQIAYESQKFMLPIRLGMANAHGPQDLIIYTLTRKGRVESTNYRTAKIPTGTEIPIFVKNEFPSFYKAVFEHSHEKENGRALLTEYAWNMGWCDPCSADPLSPDELRQLGVFWLDEGVAGPAFCARRGNRFVGPSPVVLTRLHVRYDAQHFPEDLVFQETGDQTTFQARYVLRHPYQGPLDCSAAADYRRSLAARHEAESRALVDLTGWSADSIRRKMGSDAVPVDLPWYRRIWQ